MSFMTYVLGHKWLANQLMSRLPAASHQARGDKLALRVFDTAMKRTVAYPRFLAEHGMGDVSVTSIEDFRRLPVIDKKTYIDRFPLDETVLDGDFTVAYTIEKSSGHGGTSYYWLRLPEEDALFPNYIEFAMNQFYGLSERRTLILITLALGTWTSGEKFAQALRELAATRKFPITVMAPGTNLEEILEIVNDIGDYYEQVVMVGYPPFLKSVIDEGTRKGIDWASLHVRLGVGGEGYSEQWREHMASVLGFDSRRDLLGISGGYGAADIGMSVGREYPISVMIRKLCMEDPELARTLFRDPRGNNGVLPGLVQYNPATSFVEEIDQELVFTVMSGVPLARYNIHDHGGVISFEDMSTRLRDHGYDIAERLAEVGYGREQIWQLPFFYVYGRSDGTVSIVGANIFPENIQAVLSAAGDRDVITFRLSIDTDDEYSQRLAIDLEYHTEHLTVAEHESLVVHYHQLLTNGLVILNQDFRDALEDNPKCADPKVRVHPRATGPFADKTTIKNQYFREPQKA